MTDEFQKKIHSQFLELELTFADLYWCMAEKFPEERVLFLRRQAEEQARAKQISDLKTKIEEGMVLFHEDSAQTYILNSLISAVDHLIAQTYGSRMSLPKALETTASIEQSRIERNVMDSFKTDLPELKDLVLHWKRDTTDYVSLLKEVRERHSPDSPEAPLSELFRDR